MRTASVTQVRATDLHASRWRAGSTTRNRSDRCSAACPPSRSEDHEPHRRGSHGFVTSARVLIDPSISRWAAGWYRGERTMATVLLGWELGDGLGHVIKLLEVARELAAHGIRPVLALKDFAVARPVLRDVPFPILQAPIWCQPVPPSFRASSYADILALKGFADADGLALPGRGLARADRALRRRPGHLRLRAHVVSRGVRRVAHRGDRRLVLRSLPRTVKIPPLGPRFGTILPTDRLLENVHKVQRRRGRPAPETLPAIAGGLGPFCPHDRGDRHLPGLAYRRRRRAAANPRAAFALTAAGFVLRLPECRIPRRRADPAPARRGRFSRRGVRSSGTRPACSTPRNAPGSPSTTNRSPIDRAMAAASVVIHHGGLNTAEAALAAGRVQLALPMPSRTDPHRPGPRRPRGRPILDGPLLGKGDLGLDARSRGRRRMFRAAQAFGRTIEARQYRGCLPRIVDYCHGDASRDGGYAHDMRGPLQRRDRSIVSRTRADASFPSCFQESRTRLPYISLLLSVGFITSHRRRESGPLGECLLKIAAVNRCNLTLDRVQPTLHVKRISPRMGVPVLTSRSACISRRRVGRPGLTITGRVPNVVTRPPSQDKASVLGGPRIQAAHTRPSCDPIQP